MNDLKRIGGAAVVLLVILRLSIGWQFLYEGLWKWDTQDSSNPWTSRGFLVNAQGPFRDVFRGMAGDPNEFDWLDYHHVENRWTDWANRFADHYDLDDAEYGRLMRMVQGPLEVVSPEVQMPDDVELKGRLGRLVSHEDGRLRLQTGVLDENGYWLPKYHLVPADRAALLKLLDVQEEPAGSGNFTGPDGHVAFAQAIHVLYQRQSRLSYIEKLRASLLGDPERATVVNEGEEYADSVDAERMGKIDQYRTRLAKYNERLGDADIAFQRAHLEHEWGELQDMRAELVGPVKQLEADMKADARNMLTPEQLAMGPVPERWDSQAIADWTAILALVILGALLMLGLGTRIAAFLGAGMLFTFYLVWPPFPGVPEAPGTEHALFVNKNLIEVFALLAIAAMPTGRWFGLDALLPWGGKSEEAASKNESTSDTRSAAAASAGSDTEKTPAASKA